MTLSATKFAQLPLSNFRDVVVIFHKRYNTILKFDICKKYYKNLSILINKNLSSFITILAVI